MVSQCSCGFLFEQLPDKIGKWSYRGCLFSTHDLGRMLIMLLRAVLNASGRDPELRSLLSELDWPRQTDGHIAKGKRMRRLHVSLICPVVLLEPLFCSSHCTEVWGI